MPADYYKDLAQTLLNFAQRREDEWQKEAQASKGAIEAAIEHFRGLKAGELSLNDLYVTDNGWDFVEPTPEIKRPNKNGAKEEAKA